MRASRLTLKHVDDYRDKRLAEVTRRGASPSPATLDRELELLKRFLNYAVACGKLQRNPISKVKPLNVPNVRKSVLTEETFEHLCAAAVAWLRPILVVAFDTGMRKSEIIHLRHDQLDLAAGAIRLPPDVTKTEQARVIYLTERSLHALKNVPRDIRSPYVFVNRRTGKPYAEIHSAFERAREKAGLPEVWMHDLRRSFVTNSRRAGVPESVVMKFSGHRTHAVFKRYNVVEEEDLKRAVKQLDAAKPGADGRPESTSKTTS
jgi:integrase